MRPGTVSRDGTPRIPSHGAVQAAITAGVDPNALVEVINAAQAEREAAQAEINNTSAPDLMDAAEVYARIDSFGDVPRKLSDARGEGLAELYTGLNLGILYEPDTSIAEVSMRVNSECVRGRSCTLSLRLDLP